MFLASKELTRHVRRDVYENLIVQSIQFRQKLQVVRRLPATIQFVETCHKVHTEIRYDEAKFLYPNLLIASYHLASVFHHLPWKSLGNFELFAQQFQQLPPLFL